MEPRLQVVLPVPPGPRVVAGVPAALRAAFSLAADGDVLLCTAEPATLEPWRARLAGRPIEELGSYDGFRPLRERLAPDRPLLVLAADGYPDPAALNAFLAESRSSRAPASWLSGGRPVAIYLPSAAPWLERLQAGARELPAGALDWEGARLVGAGDAAWHDLSDHAGVRRAEERLFASLSSESDGYIARLDRTISIAFSRRLLKTPVTPNHITAFSLLLGLAGSWLLASGQYWTSVLGAAMLWFCCVLDGCDGEIARLKLLATPFGATFDVIADNVVHVAIFAAIPFHVKARNPAADFWAPGLVLLAGVFLSMFWVWWVILRRPEGERAGAARVFERIASRDFIYLVAFLTVVQRLEWFLWSAAVGSHLFWLSLVAVALWRRRPI